MTTNRERINAKHLAYKAKLGSLHDAIGRMPWGWEFQSELRGDRMFVQVRNITGVVVKGYLPDNQERVEAIIAQDTLSNRCPNLGVLSHGIKRDLSAAGVWCDHLRH